MKKKKMEERDSLLEGKRRRRKGHKQNKSGLRYMFYNIGLLYLKRTYVFFFFLRFAIETHITVYVCIEGYNIL